MCPVHFRKVGIACFDHDRLPCATGLASYPSSCVLCLRRTRPFSVPPAARILLPLRGHRRSSGASLSDHSIRDGPLPFSPAGCDTGRIQRLRSVRPEPPDGGPPHWLTVATAGFHRLCSPRSPEPRILGRDSASRLVLSARTTFDSRHGPTPLTAWLPGRNRREERPSPRKPVTFACRIAQLGMNKVSTGAGNASSSRPFPGLSPGLIPGHPPSPPSRTLRAPFFCQRSGSRRNT